MRQKDGEAYFVVGSRGSGKTEWTQRATHRDTRLLVWDSANAQWSKKGLVEPLWSMDQLAAVVKADIQRPGRFRYGYAGPITITLWRKPPKQPVVVPVFPVFCRIAQSWLKVRDGSTLVIEEIADVTNPGKAPGPWGEIVRKSRHENKSKIFGLTQRPQECDSSLRGNADVIHACRMSYPDDQKLMAKFVGVTVDEYAKLQNCDWIERDARITRTTRGRLKW